MTNAGCGQDLVQDYSSPTPELEPGTLGSP